MNLNDNSVYGRPDKGNSSDDWRCHDCGKLLGKCNGQQMHIRRKPAEFMASFPITAKCPGCGALNAKNEA